MGLKSKERILCTREIQKSIKESVHQILKEIIENHEMPYTVTKNAIYCENNETEFIFHGLRDDTSKSIKSLKGVTKCWVEEAQHISKDSLDILIPTIREENSEIIFTYNRTQELDPVHARFALNPDDNTLYIFSTWAENPFFPEVSNKDRLSLKKNCEYNNNMNDYNHVWEGQPYQQSENSALPRWRVQKAMERKIKKPEGPIEIGVDVARAGSDKTAIYKRHGLKVIQKWSSSKPMRTWEVAAKALEIAGDKFDVIRVDDTGVGGGVTDELIAKIGSAKVHGINFASKKGIDRDKYPDLISHMYFEFEKILDTVDIPMDQDLLNELSSRKYHYNNSNRLRQIEPKDSFKKVYGKSPDEADALLLCFIGKKKEKFDYAFI